MSEVSKRKRQGGLSGCDGIRILGMVRYGGEVLAAERE